MLEFKVCNDFLVEIDGIAFSERNLSITFWVNGGLNVSLFDLEVIG